MCRIPLEYCTSHYLMSEIKKYYVSPGELLDSSYELASKILTSGFKPQWLLGIWRGGAPIGIAVQELFKYTGIKTDHISIRTSSYTDVGEQSEHVRVHGLEYFIQKAEAGHKVLIVDDIFDSGKSCKAVLEKIRRKMKLNTPQDIRIATVFYKPKNNKTDIKPDYFVSDNVDKWVVFPHELEGMGLREILKTKGPIAHGWVLTTKKVKPHTPISSESEEEEVKAPPKKKVVKKVKPPSPISSESEEEESPPPKPKKQYINIKRKTQMNHVDFKRGKVQYDVKGVEKFCDLDEKANGTCE